MEPAAFAHWRRWQVPLRRAAIFRLSAIACWLPLADNRKHHTRASPEKAGALKLRPGASIYRLLHCTSLLVAQSGHGGFPPHSVILAGAGLPITPVLPLFASHRLVWRYLPA